jgi:hypothetical protein
MFRSDHFHGAAVAVKLKKPFLRHSTRLYQGRVKHESILRRREKKPVPVLSGSVKRSSREICRIFWTGHTRERLGHERLIDLAEVHDLGIQGSKYLGRGTRLAQVSAVVLDRMFQHTPPDPLGHAFYFVLPNFRFFCCFGCPHSYPLNSPDTCITNQMLNSKR